jgi:streptogramin lyase
MDRYGSFWFACIRNNIHRLVTDNIPYLTFPVNNSSHVAQIHRGAFLEDNNNRVYLLLLQGTYVFNKFDVTSSLVLNRFRFPDRDTIAGGGFQDSKGNLWFGNKKGNIARFNPSTKALTYLTNNYSPGNNDVVFVPLVREDKNGNIWIANNHSLFRFNRDLNKLDHILDFKFRPQNQEVKLLNDFLIDAGGNLWILISDSILNIRLPEMKVTEYGIPGDSVFKSNYSNIRLAKDSKGNLFILNSRYGLYRFIGTDDAFVRFDLTGEDPATLWKYYIQLVEVEQAFKTLKMDLSLRPIHHQKDERIEAHIFVAFLSYCLQVTLQQRLKTLAPGLTVRSVLEKFASIQLVDVHLPTTDGRELRLPRYTEPDKEHLLLLSRLDLKLPPQPRPELLDKKPAMTRLKMNV